MSCCPYLHFFISFRNASPSVKGPAGGKHVTITVRETKTERLTPVNTPSPQGKLNAIRKKLIFILNFRSF